jgi:hypothetical protein
MKKPILKLTAISLLAAIVAITPTSAYSQDQKDDKATAASGDTAKPKRDTAPFRGKVASVDKEAKTFTVGQRVFLINDDTKIVKNGKPAKLEDAVVGDDVGGVYKLEKTADGKLVVTSVRFGPKPATEKND